MNPPRKIQFDLLTNARDSLRQSIQMIAWKDDFGPPDHARLKHAIINAAHSIELLLKERLRQVHPAFVWEKVDEYPKLDKRTVTVDTAISRLRTIAAVDTDDERILKSLPRDTECHRTLRVEHHRTRGKDHYRKCHQFRSNLFGRALRNRLRTRL
jgi:hypothetical protein